MKELVETMIVGVITVTILTAIVGILIVLHRLTNGWTTAIIGILAGIFAVGGIVRLIIGDYE